MLQEINRKIMSSGNHLQLLELDLEGGKKYEACSRVGNKNAVAGLLRHTQNQSYIFIEQYRYPVKQKVLELVAGLMDKDGLSPEQILREEVSEETGYRDIFALDFLGEVSGSAGKSTEKTFLYDVEISGKKYSQNLGEMEDISVLEVEYRDFQKFLTSKIKSGLLIDPKVCMAVYMTLGKIQSI